MKAKKLFITLTGLCLISLTYSCQTSTENKSSESVISEENLNATLWMQTSVEYEMLCRQTFEFALQNVNVALKDPDWTAAVEQTNKYSSLPPAIIVDVDETILDNSPFQARLIKNNVPYSDELWKDWVNEVKADPVPGAKTFLSNVKELGIKVFFVTNRVLQEPTVSNLNQKIYPGISDKDVLCKNEQAGWSSDKTTRRMYIASTHRILLLVGDDYNDFAFLGNATADERKTRTKNQQTYWGRKWFILPNPTYGSFDKALINYDYTISSKEKRARKYNQLRTE